MARGSTRSAFPGSTASLRRSARPRNCERRAEQVVVEQKALQAEIEAIGRQLVASGAELEAIRHDANLQHEAEAARVEHRGAAGAGIGSSGLRSPNRTHGQRRSAPPRADRGRHHGRAAAHATRIATPAPTGSIAYGRVLELWAALSIGLLLIGLVVALLVAPAYGVIAAVLLIGAFIFIESVLRGTVVALVTTISVALALLASVILAIHFWVPLLIGAALVAGVFVIAQNLRELG